MKEVQWADYFPEFSTIRTYDPRIFKTPWVKDRDARVKTRKFFASTVLGTAYGVDVIKPWATNSDEAEREAFARVQRAADFYEKNGIWPKDVKLKEK